MNAAGEGHSLYVTATTTGSMETLKMGLRQIDGTYEKVGSLKVRRNACIVDANGIVYVPKLNVQGNLDAVTLSKAPEDDKCIPSTPNGSGVYGWYSQRSESASGYGGYAHYSSVDREGSLWIFYQSGNVPTTPTRVPYSDLDFQQVTSELVLSQPIPGITPLYTFALADPRADSGGVTINQMPTTGAPTGLASIGLMSTGIGLIGVMLMLMRRRD